MFLKATYYNQLARLIVRKSRLAREMQWFSEMGWKVRVML